MSHPLLLFFWNGPFWKRLAAWLELPGSTIALPLGTQLGITVSPWPSPLGVAIGYSDLTKRFPVVIALTKSSYLIPL